MGLFTSSSTDTKEVDGSLLYIIQQYSDESGWFETFGRLGKLAFLVAQESCYLDTLDFETRNWGPYPTNMEEILNKYEEEDLIYIRTRTSFTGQHERKDYRIKDKGKNVVEQKVTSTQRSKIDSIIEGEAEKPLTNLISDVIAKYPEYDPDVR